MNGKQRNEATLARNEWQIMLVVVGSAFLGK